MARHRSRRYQEGASKVERSKRYPVEEGITLLKSITGPKFDESIELVVRIGIDPKKTDQLVRGSVSLPNGTGKSIKIAVFADGDKAQEALDAGADYVGAADLAEKIEKGFTDFDMTIASPDMMRFVGKLGVMLLVAESALEIETGALRKVGVRAFFAALSGTVAPVALALLVSLVFSAGGGWKVGLACKQTMLV